MYCTVESLNSEISIHILPNNLVQKKTKFIAPVTLAGEWLLYES